MYRGNPARLYERGEEENQTDPVYGSGDATESVCRSVRRGTFNRHWKNNTKIEEGDEMPTTIFLLICVGFLSFAVGSLAEYACRLEKRLERLEKHTQTDPRDDIGKTDV